MRRLTMLLVAVLVAGCGCKATETPAKLPAKPDKSVVTDGRLSFKLEPDGKTFAKGAPVVVTATVTNISDNAIRIPNGTYWQGGDMRFGVRLEVTGPAGVRYEPIPPPTINPPPGPDDFVVLPPGKSLRLDLDISEFVQRAPEWKLDRRLNRQEGDYIARAKFANTERGWMDGTVTRFHAPADMWLGETPWAEIAIHVR